MATANVVGRFYSHIHEGHKRVVITFNLAIDPRRIQAVIDQHTPAQRGKRSRVEVAITGPMTVVLTDISGELKPSDMLERARGIITKCGAQPQVVSPPSSR